MSLVSETESTHSSFMGARVCNSVRACVCVCVRRGLCVAVASGRYAPRSRISQLSEVSRDVPCLVTVCDEEERAAENVYTIHTVFLRPTRYKSSTWRVAVRSTRGVRGPVRGGARGAGTEWSMHNARPLNGSERGAFGRVQRAHPAPIGHRSYHRFIVCPHRLRTCRSISAHARSTDARVTRSSTAWPG